MVFSQHKTMKLLWMKFSTITQEPVEPVKAMEVVIITLLIMIQITCCPTLTNIDVSLEK
jgi:hypothetical protein